MKNEWNIKAFTFNMLTEKKKSTFAGSYKT